MAACQQCGASNGRCGWLGFTPFDCGARGAELAAADRGEVKDVGALIVWDHLSAWLTAVIVASVAWISGAVSSELPPAAGPSSAPAAERLMIGWAQDASQPPIEQVAEGTGDDVETLDEGALPAAAIDGDDPESLDAGAPVAAQGEDVETFDQGVPLAAGEPVAAAVPESAGDATATTAVAEPTTTTAAGPTLPEGFGTGQVLAVAGRGDSPIGLADCHVGAVTGRAYVGLECGEGEGSTFVGHARSFEAFPFVLEAEFPFEGDEAFFTDPNFPFGDDEELALAAAGDERADTGIFVSARGSGRERDDETSSAPAIETGGDSSVSFAQRARDRDPRVRTKNAENKSRQEDGDQKRARTQSEGDSATVESRQRERGRNVQADRANAQDEEKSSKKKRDKDKEKKSGKNGVQRKDAKRNRDR